MKHLKIQVQGIVQGVGFRPFVHRLALHNNIKGYAYNDAQGIIIHIQGNSKDTDIFLEQLKSQAPVLSKIENIEVKECPIESFNDFQIKEIESDRKILVIEKIKNSPLIYPRGKNLPKTQPLH